jgi:hypothetical protein
MRVATWNIYWLGERTGDKIQRSEADYKDIVQVIDHLSPDVLALEEIVDPLVMEKILDLASTDNNEYVIKVSDDNWLTSDSKPLDTSNDLQKVFLCINNKTIEFIKGRGNQKWPRWSTSLRRKVTRAIIRKRVCRGRGASALRLSKSP